VAHQPTARHAEGAGHETAASDPCWVDGFGLGTTAHPEPTDPLAAAGANASTTIAAIGALHHLG
jgi:hypothetical protein